MVFAMTSEMKPGDEGERSQSSLVINVWHEAGHSSPFRARITSNLGDSLEPKIRYAGSRDAVLVAVNEWLDGFPEA
jgi:hypothetical protein